MIRINESRENTPVIEGAGYPRVKTQEEIEEEFVAMLQDSQCIDAKEPEPVPEYTGEPTKAPR